MRSCNGRMRALTAEWQPADGCQAAVRINDRLRILCGRMNNPLRQNDRCPTSRIRRSQGSFIAAKRVTERYKWEGNELRATVTVADPCSREAGVDIQQVVARLPGYKLAASTAIRNRRGVAAVPPHTSKRQHRWRMVDDSSAMDSGSRSGCRILKSAAPLVAHHATAVL
jgi:hypothetical protein